MELELSINIVSSYQKVYDLTSENVTHALNSSETANVPSAMTVDLLKNAHDSAFDFVDSVINVMKYTNNPELITEIQEKFLDDAIAMYNNIFENYYEYTKQRGVGIAVPQ